MWFSREKNSQIRSKGLPEKKQEKILQIFAPAALIISPSDDSPEKKFLTKKFARCAGKFFYPLSDSSPEKKN